MRNTIGRVKAWRLLTVESVYAALCFAVAGGFVVVTLGVRGDPE